MGQTVIEREMDALAAAAARALSRKAKTLSVAESCTGGLLSGYLTSLPGSSAYFIGGVVAYHNTVKEKMMGVPGRLIAARGAVSQETALAMAHGIRKKLRTDIGIGVTGIAGPSGGTPEKPVGLVYVATSAPLLETCREFHFKGDRRGIRLRACREALKLIVKTAASFP